MLEDIPPEFLIPASFSVVVVLFLVSIVFFVGAGRSRSYEEAKAQASREAEAILRDQHSPKAKKKRSFPRRRAGKGEESAAEPPPRPGILKGVSKGGESAGERSPARSVAFELDATPKQASGPGPISPPTPYPTVPRPIFSAPLPAPLPEEEERAEEEDGEQQPGPKLGKKEVKEVSPPLPVAKPAATTTTTTASPLTSKVGGQRKARNKNKLVDTLGKNGQREEKGRKGKEASLLLLLSIL